MFGRAPKKSDNTKYYDILGVSKNASQEDLKKAYRKAAIRNHPDKGGDPEKEVEMSQEELIQAAKKSGIEEMQQALGEVDPDDEAEFPEEEAEETGGGKDLWIAITSDVLKPKGALTYDSPATSETPPQMTKKLMQDSIAAMSSELSKIPVHQHTSKVAADIVQIWVQEYSQKVSKSAQAMMQEYVNNNPNCNFELMNAVMYGWCAWEEHNITEVKNVHQSIQEMINSNLATFSGFRRSADSLLTGFKEYQRDVQALIHELKASQSKQQPKSLEVSTVPRQPVKVAPLRNETASAYVPTGDIKKDMQQFLKKIAKKPQDFSDFCSMEQLGEILGAIVSKMTQKDWNSLESMSGRRLMNKFLADAIEDLNK